MTQTTEVPILPEEVPIPLDDLVTLKEAFEEASQVAAIANNLGIRFLKEIKQSVEMAAQTLSVIEQAESQVNDRVRAAVVKSGINPEEYRGLNLEKAVFKIQKKPVEVPLANVGN